MSLYFTQSHGWSHVTVEQNSEWQLHNFFQIVDAMFAQIRDHFAAHDQPFVFDFSQLEYIDSTLITLLIQTARLTGDRRNALIVTEDKNREMLSILGVDKILDVFESRAAWESAVSPR